MQRHASPKTRRDGWTAERQLRFVDVLARTRCVTRAAAAAGLSRKSAYRLRARADGALFAALWDRAMRAPLDTAKVTGQGDSQRRLRGENPEIRRRSRSGRSGRIPGSTHSPSFCVTFASGVRER